MPYIKTSAPGTGNGTWNSGTAYTVGAGVTFNGYDHVPGSGLRFVCISANTNRQPTLSPTDANWRLAHPVDSLQLLNAIAALSVSTDFMGVGSQWSRAYRFNGLGGGLATTNQRFGITLRNTGLSGQDDVIVILSQCQSSASTPTRLIRVSSATNWLGNSGGKDDQLFRGEWANGTAYASGDVVSYNGQWWVCQTAHTASTTPAATNVQWIQSPSNADADIYRSGNAFAGPYHTHWNGGPGDIPLWFWANSQRLLWVTQSDTRFHLGYAGLLQRFGTRAQCPFPLMLCGNTTSHSRAFDDGNHINAPFDHGGTMEFLNSSGAWQSLNTIYGLMQPYGAAGMNPGLNPSGAYGLEEVPFYANTGGLLGRMDGFYFVNSTGLVSGSELSAGGNEYVVFENVYRAQSGGFVALKKS